MEIAQPSSFSAATTGASRAISISGATRLRHRGLDDAAPMIEDVGAVSHSRARMRERRLAARDICPPSENESSVMLRMPRIFMRKPEVGPGNPAAGKAAEFAI